jgi:HEAT repeat protein
VAARPTRRARLLYVAICLLPCASVGCAGFWDDVTSRDFKFESLYTSPPDPLVVLRDSKDGNQRARALRALREPKEHGGNDQDQEMVLKILTTAAVSEHQPWVRLAAIQSLGRFRDPRAVTALKSAYELAGNALPAGDVQQAAFHPPAGYQPETVAAIRCQAIEALGQTQNPASVELLVRVLRQPPVEGTEGERQEATDERIAAARALGNFKEYQATDALLKVLQTEKDVALRDCACQSLQNATGKKLPDDPKAWEALLHPANEPNGKPAKPAADAPKREKFLGLL